MARQKTTQPTKDFIFVIVQTASTYLYRAYATKNNLIKVIYTFSTTSIENRQRNTSTFFCSRRFAWTLTHEIFKLHLFTSKRWRLGNNRGFYVGSLERKQKKLS